MLHPYNILKPIIYQALKGDEYIVECGDKILEQELIIEGNLESVKTGLIAVPAYLEDVDGSNFSIFDAYGVNITSSITRANGANGWEDVTFGDTIPNIDPLFSFLGTVLFVVLAIEETIFNRTLTGDAHSDGVMLSKTYYDRLEYLYNARFGSTKPEVDETVVSYNQETGELVTDVETRILKFPLSIELSANDILPADEFVDRVVKFYLVPPYVEVHISKAYEYLTGLLSFDSSKIFIISE